MPCKNIHLNKKIIAAKAVFVAIIFCLLGACTDSNKLPNAIETYEERLTNVLGLPRLDEQSIDLPFPNRTSLAVLIPAVDMNLRDFYGIENCPIKQLIAQRNTALGKIHLPSQRFKYEVEVINTLNECVEAMAINQNLNKSLERELNLTKRWMHAKTASYADNWANLLTQSEEIYLAFNRSDGFLSGDNNEPINLAMIDLRYFLSLNKSSIDKSSPIVSIDKVEELELHLQSMQSHRFYVKFWRSLMLMEQRISALNTSLSEALPRFQCNSVSNKSKFDILRNVFTKYFIQGLQPMASALNNYQYQLSPLLIELSNHPDLPDAFKTGIQNRHTTLVAKYEETIKLHIEIWQSFFQRCAINPTTLTS